MNSERRDLEREEKQADDTKLKHYKTENTAAV